MNTLNGKYKSTRKKDIKIIEKIKACGFSNISGPSI